jgi:hypothetical protein
MEDFMIEILSALLIATAIAACLVAFFAVLGVFFSQRIAKIQRIAEQTPGKAFAVGLVNALFFTAISLFFFALANGAGGAQLLQMLGLLFLVIPGVGAVFGLAGLVQLTGERLFPRLEGIRRTAAGTLTLGLACSLPFAGWFGLLPFLALLGLGAFILSFFSRPRTSSSAGEVSV